MFFALVGKREKNLAPKNSLLFISVWINKSLGVKLLSCNTNRHRDSVGLLNLSPTGSGWEPQARKREARGLSLALKLRVKAPPHRPPSNPTDSLCLDLFPHNFAHLLPPLGQWVSHHPLPLHLKVPGGHGLAPRRQEPVPTFALPSKPKGVSHSFYLGQCGNQAVQEGLWGINQALVGGWVRSQGWTSLEKQPSHPPAPTHSYPAGPPTGQEVSCTPFPGQSHAQTLAVG